MNRAFIDGQNFYRGVSATAPEWQLDYARFRRYLREKYKVDEAYYYIGYYSSSNESLYDNLQRAGFILRFRERVEEMITNKKGNVDTDIVFGIMRSIADNDDFDKVVLVSGDGDYYRTVKYLVDKDRLEKVLFPNFKFASSLYYRQLSPKYYATLNTPSLRNKIGRR